MAGSTQGNSKVTLAVLSTKLDHLRDDLREDLKEIKETVRVDHDRIGALEGRVTAWQFIQTSIAVGLSALAGFVGTRR